MKFIKLISRLNRLAVVLVLVVLATVVMSVPGKEVFAVGGPEYFCDEMAGEWDPASQTCTIKKDDYVAKFSLDDWYSFVSRMCGNNYDEPSVTTASIETNINTVVLRWMEEYFAPLSCSNITPLPQTRSRCKLVEVESSAAFGNSHTIKATYLGKASYLRLGGGGQFYQLPMVPGSEQYAGGNLWSARFFTTNTLTGGALAPPGKYKVRCFGPEGTIGGVGTITLGK